MLVSSCHLYWLVRALSQERIHCIESYLTQGRHLICIHLVNKLKWHKLFCYSFQIICQNIIIKLISDGVKKLSQMWTVYVCV